MEFNEDRAKEIIEKFSLDIKTLRVWKSRNSIPDRYFDENYQPAEKVEAAGRIILSRLAELRKSEVLNFSVIAKLAGVDRDRINDAIKGGCINRSDIDAFVKEIKKQRVFILNSLLERQEQKKLNRLLENKGIKHYVILGKNSWSNSIIYALQNQYPIAEIDYIQLKDLYLRATILMNI